MVPLRPKLSSRMSCLALVAGMLAVPPAQAATDDGFYLSGNDEVLAAAEAEGWPGTGTAADPIVISGYQFDVDLPHESALRISATDLHLLVTGNRFVDVTGSHLVVEISLARNVRIEGNEFSASGASYSTAIHCEGILPSAEEDPFFATVDVRDNAFAMAGDVALAFVACSGAVEGNAIEDGQVHLAAGNLVVRDNDLHQASLSAGFPWSDSDLGRIEILENRFDRSVLGVEGNILAADNTFDVEAGAIVCGYGWIEAAMVRNNTLNGAGRGTGIEVMDCTVEGNTITGFDVGIQRSAAPNPDLPPGLSLRAPDLNVASIRGNRIEANQVGVLQTPTDSFTLVGNHLVGNGIGYAAADPDETGQEVAAEAADNLFDNAVNAAGPFAAAVARDSWIEPALGPNVVGGPLKGGNWWSDYTGVDENQDGFGDTPYESGAVHDPLPLVRGPTPLDPAIQALEALPGP